MGVLHPAPVSTRQFTYSASERLYTGEISSTHGFGQVYDDACDVGLTLVSATTGKEVVLVVCHEERNSDRDIVSWTLKPATTRDAHLNLRVILLND